MVILTSICLINNIDLFFPHVLFFFAICISPLICVVKHFAQLYNWAASFHCIEFWELFLYSRYKSFIRHTICVPPSMWPVCLFSNQCLLRGKSFNEVKWIKFPFVDHALFFLYILRSISLQLYWDAWAVRPTLQVGSPVRPHISINQ